MNTSTTTSLQEQLDDRDATIHELQERLQDRTAGLLEAIQSMGLEIARLKREKRPVPAPEPQDEPHFCPTCLGVNYSSCSNCKGSSYAPGSKAFLRWEREQEREKARIYSVLALYEHGHITESQARLLAHFTDVVSFRLHREQNFAQMCRELDLPETTAPLPHPSATPSAEYDKLKAWYTEIVKELGDDLVLKRINALTTAHDSANAVFNQIHALLSPGEPTAEIPIVATIEKLVERCALLDWIAENVGNIDFHVMVPRGVMSSNPWIALGSNFEACIAKTRAELEKATAAISPTEAPPEKVCPYPPPGWKCTRPAGHRGPCAAIELTPSTPPA